MKDFSATPEITADEAILLPSAGTIMQALYSAAEKVAELEWPVLILGEAGAGKRTVAQHIHDCSAYRNEAFRVIDSVQFSAAVAEGNGVHKLLSVRGMVFFRNAGRLSTPAQDRILKVIQNGQGPMRMVMAGGEDLDHEVRAHRIGEEFYHAVGSVTLRVPPLRARREDILLLAEHFLQRYARAFGQPKPEPSIEAVEFLRNYRWPGNVTELETAMKSWAAIGDEALVLAALRASAWANGRNEGTRTASLKQAARAASLEAERELISDVLISTGWNRKRAAQRLQISYKALLYKLKRIGMESPPLPSQSGEHEL